MSKKSIIVCWPLVVGLLGGCTTTGLNQAPIVEHTTGAEAPKPVAAREAPKPRDEYGMYTVKKGDTLHRIALDNGQNYRDLVAWNNLADPNDIKVDQVLRVLPPEAGNGGPASAATAPADSRGTPKKTAPRADKRPYSDAALAELQRPDGAPAKGEAGRPEIAKAEPKGDKAVDDPSRPIVRPTVVPLTPSAPVPAPAPLDEEKLSWMWPSDGRVIATFDDGKSKGIDIAGKAGQQVMAASAGKVMYAGSGIRGYGNLVIVKHSNTLLSAYAHNRTILVKEGQTVSKGQPIAEMGDSDTDAVKLHFEIRQQGKPVDPSKFLPNR